MSGISSPFGQNEWLVEEMYRKFRDDPDSVDESWHEFLIDYKPDAQRGGGSPAPAAPVTPPTPAAAPAPAAPAVASAPAPA
ncbi:2-oxoglutarate dehydrogenase E1 subunit family protein, partial [[Mycobacterium] nativiensis]